VGPFSLEQAVTLEQARQAFEEGWWMAVLRPLDEALLDYPALIVGAPLEQRIRQGQRIPGPQPQGERDVARAYNERGEFIGTLRYDYIYDEWQPVKVFPP
jgi:tRNA U55 pseudouridine synthase TruB